MFILVDIRDLNNKINHTSEDTLRINSIYNNNEVSLFSYFNIDREVLPWLRMFRELDLATSVIFKYAWASILKSGPNYKDGLKISSISSNLSGNNNFLECYEKMMKRPGEQNLPFNLLGLIYNIWLPSLCFTCQYVGRLISGNIKVRDVLNDTEGDNEISYKEELIRLQSFFKINVSSHEIEACAMKLNYVKTLKITINYTSEILNIAKVFQLEGDFESIKKIRENVR